MSNVKEYKLGTSKAYALKKLEEARPDLLKDVLNGKLSANKAMVVAGFRKAQASIPLDNNTIDSLDEWADDVGLTRTQLMKNILLTAIEMNKDPDMKEEARFFFNNILEIE